ncbi:MAG: DNA-deoxyinosine glycosylase [Clostridia bacterium]|nr:DNA-deoxyinosine glycosylase [Clostridia bacterium]
MTTDFVTHPFPPLFDENAQTLILGSFPSVKSRETMFFYGHPQNRFWKVLSTIFMEKLPESIEEKKGLVLRHHLALWDCIHSCTVTGSSDSSIKDVVPNDISEIITNSKIDRIFCNGTLSHKMYNKYIFPTTGIEAIKLPSTSPANASYSLDRLITEWKIILPEWLEIK